MNKTTKIIAKAAAPVGMAVLVVGSICLLGFMLLLWYFRNIISDLLGIF